MRSIRHGAHYSYRTYALFQRQHFPLILQQDGGFFRCPFSGGQMRFIIHHRRALLIHIRIVKQSQTEFDPQNVPHRFIYHLFFHLSGFNLLGQAFEESITHHFHIHSGIHRQSGCFFVVGGKSMGYHLPGRIPVCHYQSVEAPFITKYIPQNKLVSGRRHSIVIIERSHESSRTCFGRRLKRRQINIAQTAFRNKGRVIVTSSLCCSITDKVLGASGNRSRIVQRIALETFHHSRSHHRRKIGIFAATLGNTSPTGIAGDVNHRSKGPTDTYGRGLDGRYPGSIFCHFRVKRRSLPQRNRKNRFKTVNDIACHQQRNAQTGLFYRHTLQRIDTHRIYFIQNRTDFTFLYQSTHVLDIPVRRNLVHLPDFFFQGHLGQQSLNLLFNNCISSGIRNLRT